MLKKFLLLRLVRSEMDRLEKLRQLEMKLLTAPPGAKPGIEWDIDAIVDEITQLSRAIQDLKANRSLAMQS